MTNRILVLLLLCMLFFSCKKEQKPVVKDDLKPEILDVATSECYEYIQGKDTIQANLQVQSPKVTGDLVYKIFEKDSNKGSIEGTIIGDTLKADYTFLSEGQKSIRQVVFLRKNKSLIEGYGDVEEKAGKMVFKEKKKLNFTGNVVLNEIPCK